MSKVLSCPPCMLPVLVKTQAGFPASAPLNHSDVLPSQKYFIGAAIFPKRVGEPKARPMHSWRSLYSAYGDPSLGTADSVDSQTVDIEGTVLRRAFAPGILSIPSAMSRARSRVAPDRE